MRCKGAGATRFNACRTARRAATAGNCSEFLAEGSGCEMVTPEMFQSITVGVSLLLALGALITAVRATMEFRAQGRQKRADYFDQMRLRLKSDESFRVITEYIATGDERLKDESVVSVAAKMDYACFFEQIAIMRNSGLISSRVAHYMIGFYALECWKSDAFWNGGSLDRDATYWRLFRAWVIEMSDAEKRLDKIRITRRTFRF